MAPSVSLSPCPTLDDPAPSLSSTVVELCSANAAFLRGPNRRLGRRALPSRDTLTEVVKGLRAALFPWHFGGADVSPEGVQFFIGHTLEACLSALTEQIRIGLLLECGDERERCNACSHRARQIVGAFSARLARIRDDLGTDAQAALDGDPAARSLDEVIFCYPTMTAMLHHRIAHELHELGAPLIPRIISQLSHAHTGIDIHPAARIGRSFFVDHGTGVVIGETCRIGEHVRIYQGVTLGARSIPTDEQGRVRKGVERHPRLGDRVVIYAGATILGPVEIGADAVIGGNVWLTANVEAGAKVTQPQPPALRVSRPA